MHYDVIIVGAGIAGLYSALHLPPTAKVLIIHKATPWECNTYYAQGGVSTAYNTEDIPAHIDDTLHAGAGLCSYEAVAQMSHASQEVIHDLIARGFEFDHDEEGRLLYTKEAAHSRKRILHAGGDATGRYVHYFLYTHTPHPILSHTTVIDLLIDEGRCYGVEVLSHGERKQLFASHIILASGGIGSLYAYHTNAHTISADLQGICLDHGIALERMEMTQFHPTVFVSNTWARKFLLTEALRGEGAHVVNEHGYRFLFEYDPRGELAPRDIVSRAIFDYKQRTHKEVYLSCRDFDKTYFAQRFPTVYRSLTDLGFSLPEDLIPISPAFHYAIGGIVSDLEGRTSIEGLYAVGEVASTQVHGANRLASNSLLEGLVFARAIARTITTSTLTPRTPPRFIPNTAPLELLDDKEKKEQLRQLMWDHVSIVRTHRGLTHALEHIDSLLAGEIGRLLRLRLLSARSIVQGALEREASVGVHYRIEE